MDRQILRQESMERWRPPAGLDRSRPRLVKLTATGKLTIVLAIVLELGAIGAGAGLSSLVIRQTGEARIMQAEGLVAEGRVTRLWRTGDKGHEPRVSYQFVADGRIYDQSARLPLGAWRRLRVGSYLPVRYAGSRPDLNYPDGYASGSLPFWVPVLVAVVLAVVGFLATLPVRSQSRLLSSGRAAPGVVTMHGKAMRTSHGSDLGQQFYYEFLLLSGARRNGKGGPIKNPPPIGSTVVVVYDPDDPRRNAPYPLSLVRLPETSAW